MPDLFSEPKAGVDLFGKEEEAGVDLFGPKATFTGAVGTGLVQGVRKSTGGLMEAGGDLISSTTPEELQRLKTVAEAPVSTDDLSQNRKQGELAQDSFKKYVRGKLVNMLPDAVGEFGRNLTGAGAELGEEAQGKIETATPKDMNILQEAAVGASVSTGQLLPFLAMRKLPGVGPGFADKATLGSLSAISGTEAYHDAKEKTGDAVTAFKSMVLNGAAEYGGEKLGLDALLKKGPGWFKNLLLKEIGGEEATTVAQSLTEKGLYNPDKWSSKDEILHDLAVTALSAGIQSGAVGGAQKGLERIAGKRKERNFDADAAQKELEIGLHTALAEQAAVAAGMPPPAPGEVEDQLVTVPPITSELTGEELATAALQEQQLSKGLDVALTEADKSYGATIRNSLAADGMGQGGASEAALDVGGMTEEVAARRQRSADLGSLPIDQRPITISATDGKVLGLTLQQTGLLPAGAVVATAANEDEFPLDAFTPVVKIVKDFVDKYMPNSRVILNLETLGEGQFGSSKMITDEAGNITHVITPRDLASFKYQGGDVKTKMNLLTSLSHEFGHALKSEQFFAGIQGLGTRTANGIQRAVATGSLTENHLVAIDKVAPEEGALLRDWQRIRSSVLDGTMTAREFTEQWVGARKLGDSVSRTDPKMKSLYDWANRQLGSSGKTLEGSTALELVEAAYGDTKYALNFDEFMAEQFSRAATGDLTKFTEGTFLARTMQALRDLFRTLKAEHLVAPGVTFQAWLDKQTARAAAEEKPGGKFELSKKVLAAQKKLLAAKGLTPTGRPSKAKKKAEPPPEQVAPPADIVSVQVDEKMDISSHIDQLMEYDIVSEKQAEIWHGMVERGQLPQVEAQIARKLGETMNKDRERAKGLQTKLPDHTAAVAETLQATILWQDATAQQQANWEIMLENHPEGISADTFTVAIALDSVPLEPIFTSAPVYEDGLVETTVSWGVKELADEIAQTRRSDDRNTGERMVLEVGLPLTPDAVKQRLVREEIAQAVEDGRTTLYFTPDLPATTSDFLRTKHDALLTEHNGRYWWAVALQDKTKAVPGWDKTNPLQPPSPAFTVESLAGLTIQEMRQPHIVAEAQSLWKRLGTESPFFKRWLGTSDIHKVWRGDGAPIHFLDSTMKGKLTYAQSAKKAFWFTDNHEGAQYYAETGQANNVKALTMEAARRTQALRVKMNEAREFRNSLPQGKEWDTIDTRIWRLEKEIAQIEEDNQVVQPAPPSVAQYFLKLENPYVVDMDWASYSDELWMKHLNAAAAAGHDGVIFKRAYDPMRGTIYAIFQPEQAKIESNIGTFGPTDELHFDKESEGAQATRASSRIVEKIWDKTKLNGLNSWARLVDATKQLQQVAAGLPARVDNSRDYMLHTFLRRWGEGQALKNRLQFPAEELVKDMVQLSGQSKQRISTLHSILQAESKSGNLQAPIIGYDLEGNVIWGGDVGFTPQGFDAVQKWEIDTDSLVLRKFFLDQGVDVTTEEGAAVLELYKRTRELFLFHFAELRKGLVTRIALAYSNAPELQKRERIGLNGLMTKLMQSPFVPQGNFGNYVITVQKDLGPVPFGQRRFKTVFKQHFENKTDFDMAYAEMKRKELTDKGIKVKSQILEETGGIPMQLPNDLLEKLGHTGEFTGDQINLLADIMNVTKYDRIADKYDKIGKQYEGGSQDFTRVLADFSWRNANYVWKMNYRFRMQQAISAEKQIVKRIESGKFGPVAEREIAEMDERRRHIRMMQEGLNYVMSPPQEFQTARGFITMAYLAGNVKTAILNTTTMINTAAAVTSEYGEVEGGKAFTKSLKQTMEVWGFVNKRDKGTATAFSSKDQMTQQLLGVYDRALKEGILDQSFAYYLAGEAHSGGLLKATRLNKVGEIGHKVLEMGMMPFQLTEKANRMHSLFTFYQLERKRGVAHEQAYQRAVAKTNQLQNSYDAVNKPRIFRGKAAILTMFASYTQFMWWVSTGGYERGARRLATAEGRSIAPAYRGTTAKIWLAYMLLGGWMGIPFMQNLMDIVQWVGRKFFNGMNVEAEARQLVTELGMDANMVQHGLMHDFGGFDLSASFGLGRMLPGTDLLRKEKPQTATEMIGSMATTFSGPAGNFYKSLVEAIGTVVDDPVSGRQWVEAGKKMPGAIGSISKMMDAALEQHFQPTEGVTTRDGRRMTFDAKTGEYRDLTTAELVGMSLSFNPTILSENRERNYAVMSEVFYWQTRRSDLMDRYWQAYRSGDEVLRKEVVDMQTQYNETAPDRNLRITGKDRANSVKQHKKMVAAGEGKATAQKKYRGVAQEVSEEYGR